VVFDTYFFACVNYLRTILVLKISILLLAVFYLSWYTSIINHFSKVTCSQRDGYGLAIANAFKTPEAGDVFSSKYLLSELQKLYNQLVILKKQRSAELAQPETLENINITSERITRIQRRVSMLDSFPSGLDRTNVRNTFKKLNTWKETKGVQKLLREYTDGEKSKLDDATFVVSLVQDTDILNLIASEGIKPTSLKVSLAALLLRA